MENITSFPFLTRKMLRFEESTAFSLRVKIISDAAYSISLRGMTREGIFKYNIQTTGTYTAETFDFALSDIPISITLDTSGSSVSIVYLKVNVALVINGTRYLALIQGTLNGNETLSWPTISEFIETQKRGFFTGITGAVPGAGMDIIDIIPAKQWWRLKGIEFALTTSATVATRRVKVAIGPTTPTSLVITSAAAQVASTAVTYTFLEGSTFINDTDSPIIQSPLPLDLWLPAGTQLATFVSGLQAGDQFTNAVYIVELHFQLDL